MREFTRVSRLTAACCTIAIGGAVPATAAIIDFSGLMGANQTAFTSYVEDGFSVSNQTGQFYVGQLLGNPVPSLFSGSFYGSTAASVTVEAVGGADFTFSAFDFASNGGSTAYTLFGSRDGATVFTLSATPSQTNGFVPVTPGSAGLLIDRLHLDFVGSGTSYNIDNLAVSLTPVPEPMSLALFGAAVLGLGLAQRRR